MPHRHIHIPPRTLFFRRYKPITDKLKGRKARLRVRRRLRLRAKETIERFRGTRIAGTEGTAREECRSDPENGCQMGVKSVPNGCQLGVRQCQHT